MNIKFCNYQQWDKNIDGILKGLLSMKKNRKFHCNECKTKALKRAEALKEISGRETMSNLELARTLRVPIESVIETKKLL